jgi:hypothetical protein
MEKKFRMALYSQVSRETKRKIKKKNVEVEKLLLTRRVLQVPCSNLGLAYLPLTSDPFGNNLYS